MSKRAGAVPALALLASMMATAQPVPPDAAASQAAAAMERARRQAAGPMRVILEASKSRRRPGEAESPSPVPPGIQPAGQPGPPSAVATASPAARPSAAPEAAAPAPSADSGITTQITLSSGALQNRPAPGLPLAGIEATSGKATALDLPGAVLALPEVLAAMPARARLISRVDPEVSQRVLDEMGRNLKVVVELTIRADGRVAAVNPLGAVPRLLQRALVEALTQWRFEPLPQELVHRVELVFNSGP